MKEESITQHARGLRPRSSTAAILLVAGLAGCLLYVAHAAFVARTQQEAEAVRKAAARTSFLTALAMMIGAFVACAAAALGGHERDRHP
jgi:hypothetical protein